MTKADKHDIPVDTDIVIHFEEGKETARMIGQWVKETEEWVIIKGTVGSHMGHLIRIPKFRVVFIEE